MVEMPATVGTPTVDEAIRSLELTWNYFVITGEVKEPQTLGQFTSRSAIEDALSPNYETRDQSLARYCRHALEWFALKPGASKSTKAGATRLKGTMRRFIRDTEDK